jgi:type III pantothenate kinase
MSLLAMDIGNTNIKLGVFDKDKLISSWRIQSKTGKTADEYGLMVGHLFERDGISLKDVNGIIMSSVIPSLNYTLEHMCLYYFGKKPIVIGPGIKTSINIKYDNPKEVGADRIVNSVAAYRLYGGPCIVVDFGTATTFNAVSKAGEFLGGAICPGIKISIDAMVANAAKLPKIELIKPDRVIGKNTITNMQSGIVYGFTGMVRYIIDKMKEELDSPQVKVIATGGLSELLFSENKMFDIVDRKLTLEGLKIIYDYNNN